MDEDTQTVTEGATGASSEAVLTDGLGMPKEPTMGLLISMAIRYDHGLAIPSYYDNLPIGQTHKQRFDSTISMMRQIYEEVSGHGFYSKDKEAEYLAMMPNI